MKVEALRLPNKVGLQVLHEVAMDVGVEAFVIITLDKDRHTRVSWGGNMTGCDLTYALKKFELNVNKALAID